MQLHNERYAGGIAQGHRVSPWFVPDRYDAQGEGTGWQSWKSDTAERVSAWRQFELGDDGPGRRQWSSRVGIEREDRQLAAVNRLREDDRGSQRRFAPLVARLTGAGDHER